MLNSTKGKTERIGRLLKMHANKREEIKEVNAGDIAAAVGLKSVTTGDTLCDEKKPILLESMEFPEPVISLAIEPKTKADQEKLGQGMAKLMAEDPTFRVATDEQTGQVVIAGMGELHLEIIVDRLKREFGVEASVGKPQVAYKETLTRPAEGHGRFIRQTGGRGQFGDAKIRLIPLRAGHRLPVRERDRRRLDPEGIHQADRSGHPGSAHARRARRLPDRRCPHRALRRVVPRGRLVGNGVQDRRLDGVPGRGQEGQAGAAGAGHARRSRRAEGLPRRRDGRPGVAPRQASSRRKDRGGTQIISARVPLSEMFGYATDLRSRTQGRATYSMHFDRYEQAPRNVSEEVIARVQGTKVNRQGEGN